MQHKFHKLSLLSISLLSTISFAFESPTSNETHVIVAPSCLTNQLNAPFTVLSATKTLNLIKTNQTGVDQLIAAKANHKILCGGFMDVTENFNEFNAKKTQANPKQFLLHYDEVTLSQKIPVSTGMPHGTYAIKYPAEVERVLKQLNPENMWANLTTLSNFNDRYAKSDNGVKAAAWIKNQVETIAKNTGHDDVTVYYVATGTSYKQSSVVAKIGNSNEPGIVIGGHMDTLSSSFEKKPGADDDGTGTVTVLETTKSLLESGLHFKKPIYVVWYAAEEEGLIGSGYVVKDFKKKNIPVDAVIQFDMTGYAYKNDRTLWLINDYVDKDLTSFLETLTKTYVKQPVKYTSCGYACSDHASWHAEGYKSSIPFEAAFGNDDPYIHTARDTMDVLSLDHMTDFAKLAIAFAVELAEPIA